MSNELVRVLNTQTGRVGTIRRRLLDHAILGKNLVEVEEGRKPYAPELYRSRTPEEFTASRHTSFELPDSPESEYIDHDEKETE